MEHKSLTGKTRMRAHLHDGAVLLVLQVEERMGRYPGGVWRDAKIEDLRAKDIEVRA